jgi:hypothetical protein
MRRLGRRARDLLVADAGAADHRDHTKKTK